MKYRAPIAALVAALVLAVQFLPPAASADSTQVLTPGRIRFVFPDSPETSNAPFPPNQDSRAVQSQLHHVMVKINGRQMPLGQYLRSRGIRLSSIVTVKIQGDAAAIYQYR